MLKIQCKRKRRTQQNSTQIYGTQILATEKKIGTSMFNEEKRWQTSQSRRENKETALDGSLRDNVGKVTRAASGTMKL